MSVNEEPDLIILEIPADVKYLEAVASVLQAVLDRAEKRANDAQSHFSVRLAVHETCTNVIEHAYHGQPGRIKIEVNLYRSVHKIVVDIYDQGDPADLSNVAEPNLDVPQINGYGLYLMNQLVDKVEYTRDQGVNRWRLIKTL